MKSMKTIGLIGASALALTAVSAAPSLAQPWRAPAYDHGYDRSYDRRIDSSYVDSLDWRITNAARQGMISWQDARAMRADLRQVQPIAYRVQTGRASNWEYRRLMRVVNRIEAATRTYAVNAPPRWGYRR
jgi:hypothetical protein